MQNNEQRTYLECERMSVCAKNNSVQSFCFSCFVTRTKQQAKGKSNDCTKRCVCTTKRDGRNNATSFNEFLIIFMILLVS